MELGDPLSGHIAAGYFQIATINPARMLGQQIGRIRPGYKADLMVLNSKPLGDIRILERPEDELLLVVKDGRICQSSLPGVNGLLESLAKL